MTFSISDVTRTDGCEGLPAPARVPDPIPLPGRRVFPYPTDEAWQDPATVRQIAAFTDPTRDELCDMYGTADPDELRLIPFVLAEDVAAADRVAREQVAA